jgi:hypothetical protein
MRSTLKEALGWIASLPHPQPASLIALHDGELTGSSEAAVKAHLERCSYCHKRLDEILDGLRFVNRETAFSMEPFSIDAGLVRLSSAIHNGNLRLTNDSLPAADSRLTILLYSRLLSELSLYLGRGTATRLLSRFGNASLQRDGISAAVGPVVKTFLGEDAGAAVLANILRIWDTTEQVAGEGAAL